MSGQDHGRLEVQPGGGPDDRRVDDRRHVDGLHARVVDQHVDRSEVGLHARDEILDGCRVGQVDGHGVTVHLGGHRIQLV